MASSIHPRLLANQLVLDELLKRRRTAGHGRPAFGAALLIALRECDKQDVDDITKAEVRAFIIAMRRYAPYR